MASSTSPFPDAPQAEHQNTTIQDVSDSAAPDTAPMESSSLQKGVETDTPIGSSLNQSETHKSISKTSTPYRAMRSDTTTAILSSQNPPASPPPMPSSTEAPEFDRTASTAIGPSSDTIPTDAPASTGPVLMITLLLLSGARHPFNLDAGYLSKRSVQVSQNNPFNLSVYKVKELILREWRSEWESKPSSPSAIRLIHFGKVLDDKAAIKDLKFNEKSANVVHMSIKPQDFMEDEDAKGTKATRTQSHDGTDGRSPGCRCIVM